THDEQRLEMALAQMAPDLGCIAAGEAIRARLRGDIIQEAVGVARGKIHVPLEWRAEPCARLLGGARPLGAENRQAALPCQLAKQRPVVLHRMRCQDGETVPGCLPESIQSDPLQEGKHSQISDGRTTAASHFQSKLVRRERRRCSNKDLSSCPGYRC